MSIILASMTLSVSATTLTCDPKVSCNVIEKLQELSDQIEQAPERQANNMARVRQEILLELMKSQAEARQEIRKTARLALSNLQQLAVSSQYNQFAAKELTKIYGDALAELTYLDLQLTVRFRNRVNMAESRTLQD